MSVIEYENLKLLNESFKEEFDEAYKRVSTSGRYILGNEVLNFEKQFAEFLGVGFCVGVASGLDALLLAIKVLDLKRGSEILVPSNTYIATIIAILNAGFKPVLVEPNIATYNIEVAEIEKSISKNTAAILVVHLYGQCCKMDDIVELAKENNLRIIEDCAQAHGAKYKNMLAGTFGDVAAWSFYPTKNLGAMGDAGAVTCNKESYKNRLQVLRNYGSEKKYYNQEIGINSRLDELQAAFLLVKLKHLNKINDHKNELATIYNEKLNSNIIKPIVMDDFFNVYHIYNIRTPKRDDLKLYLEQNGIVTEIHYPVAPNKQEALKKLFSGINTPIAEEIHNTTLSLPISYFHSVKDAEWVSAVLNRF
jgi:dTDP-4-amino-4,6-dideoxygalactose transaminase